MRDREPTEVCDSFGVRRLRLATHFGIDPEHRLLRERLASIELNELVDDVPVPLHDAGPLGGQCVSALFVVRLLVITQGRVPRIHCLHLSEPPRVDTRCEQPLLGSVREWVKLAGSLALGTAVD